MAFPLGTAPSPLPSDTGDELEPTEDERVHRGQRDVHSEEHKKPLILLPHAVVHPGAVMIHFPNASFANTAVVGTLGLDAAALGALVDHLSRLQLQALHEFLCGVSFGYRPGVGEHGPQVRGQGQHRQAVEGDAVEHGVPEVLGRQQHDEGHHEVGVHHQEPRQDGTDHAAAVADEPDPVRPVGLGGRGRRGVVGVTFAQQRVVLDIPEPVSR